MGKKKFGLSSLLRRGATAATSSSSKSSAAASWTQKRKQKQDDRVVATMISEQTRLYFRCVLFVFFGSAVVLSGYAPNKGPNLPADFCPHGDITATTGECMCHWQHKDGCKGSGCQYQMGLSFYHHSCTDCKCIKEP